MWGDRRTFLRRVGASLVFAGIAGATRSRKPGVIR